MNAKSLLAIVAFATVAATGAQAGEIDPSQQFAVKVESNRTRAEVMAEAAKIPATRSTEPAGSRVAPLPTSGLQVQAVRSSAADAVRLGQISHGELGM
jgi:hypothetical protein